MPPIPEWLVPEPFTDTDLGVLRTGKEAQVDLIERCGDDRSALLAVKRYLPREVKAKGLLEAMGVQQASQFRHDVAYREGRQFRKSRDRRAVEQMTTHGKQLLQQRWTNHEHDVMQQLWAAGVRVPFPVSFGDDRFVMEYIGEPDQAAPTLARARPRGPVLADIWRQLITQLRIVVACGWVHGDLSAYNLLWWQGEVWLIDFPQAVDLAANPGGLDFLHRDLTNVADWFERQGHPIDAEAAFADLLFDAM
ncbi:MAG TPA: RIO1 family regulatory kinase/ATPase [Acidimicrobiales bacterium]|nr:RIO1 family regulatory kinase/ATPase [Acidimicrobiales bacterium]